MRRSIFVRRMYCHIAMTVFGMIITSARPLRVLLIVAVDKAEQRNQK